MTPLGSTARWIAAARALETESDDPLFRDPFARELAGESAFAVLADTRSSMGTPDTSGPMPYLSIRTRFFDDLILSAVDRSSIAQVVVLGAGMDTRAHRLQWPAGITLFEVDRADVFDHKEPVLKRLNARPTCDRRIVQASVTADKWSAALEAAGFDLNLKAAFLVEGLLYYLEDGAARNLMNEVSTLAREGSWIGLDLANVDLLRSPYMKSYLDKMDEYGCPLQFGLQDDPERFLAEYGWKGTVVLPGEPDANYGRWPYPRFPRTVPGVPRFLFADGQRTAAKAV